MCFFPVFCSLFRCADADADLTSHQLSTSVVYLAHRFSVKHNTQHSYRSGSSDDSGGSFSNVCVVHWLSLLLFLLVFFYFVRRFFCRFFFFFIFFFLFVHSRCLLYSCVVLSLSTTMAFLTSLHLPCGLWMAWEWLGVRGQKPSTK